MRLRNIFVFGAMALFSWRVAMAQDSSPGSASPADASGAIELPEVEVQARAVQRSIVSPFSNGIEEFEGQRRTKDSLGRKSLNLCGATESFGGCLEVIRTFPLAARNNPRSAARRRQTLPTAACPAVFHFRDCERCQFVSRHPHLHQGPSATAEQSL